MAEWQQCKNRIRYVNNLGKEHKPNRSEKVRFWDLGDCDCEL